MKIRSVGLAPLLAAWLATAWMATLAMTLAPIADSSPTTSVDGAGRGCDSSGAGRGVQVDDVQMDDVQMDGVQMDRDRVPGDVEINNSHTVHFPPAYPDFASRGIYHHGRHHH
jgi:hypothetical protein